MTDAKTLAYINLYGILGALENLCELDEEASKLAQVKKPLSIAFSVKGGPDATITFKNSRQGLHEDRLPSQQLHKADRHPHKVSQSYRRGPQG